MAENRWLDRLKILSWHHSLASQQDMESVCSREHLKILVVRWLTQASLHLPPADFPSLPVENASTVSNGDLGPAAVGRLVGELAVHRESFSRVWSGSPGTLECILDALITIGAENKPDALEFQLFDPPDSAQGLSLQ